MLDQISMPVPVQLTKPWLLPCTLSLKPQLRLFFKAISSLLPSLSSAVCPYWLSQAIQFFSASNLAFPVFSRYWPQGALPGPPDTSAFPLSASLSFLSNIQWSHSIKCLFLKDSDVFMHAFNKYSSFSNVPGTVWGTEYTTGNKTHTDLTPRSL